MHHPRFNAFRKRVLESFPARFWKQIKCGDKQDCWPWLGHRSNTGYGRVSKLGTMYLAHRIAWELAVGEVPNGLKVLHKCDNPPCCNPDHLFTGTMRDNTLDCMGKLRYVFMNGSKNGNSKLTEADVMQIRKLYPIIRSQRKVAKKFKVSRRTIIFILQRKTWKHV